MKYLLFILLLPCLVEAQTPQAFPLIKIGQYIVFDSVAIPTAPPGNGIKVFGRGLLGVFARFADGNVVRLDSTVATVTILTALFELDGSSNIQPTNGTGWGNASALWETDVLGNIINTTSGTLDSLYEIDISGNIEPRL